MKKDNRYCLICNPKNRTIYFHRNEENGKIWLYCNKCDRGYSLEQYCNIADIDMTEFLTGDFYMQEAEEDTVQAMAWPSSFVPLSDPRAEKGVQYIKSRGLTLDGDMYYDLNEEGIVFPYYVENHFCGAQVRFIKERVNEDGDVWKITTLPGTRLGLMFYGWNQSKLMAQIKGIIVCEGAFNALGIQQALNQAYGSVGNPWRVIAASGSGATESQRQTLKELKDKGYKVVIAPDTDEAGMKMYQKFIESECATHYAFTGDTTSDWNDKLKELGHKEFAKFVIKSITPIDE
jgi:5S rRNA maturation endonuclease (ribonuclease M5)